MSGFFGDLSKKQEAVLKQFKTNIADVWRDEFNHDSYLLRWLRARDFDLRRSERMIRNHLNWRQTESIDDLLEKFVTPEAVTLYYPGGFCGHDKEGYPIRMDPLGHVDPKGLFQVATYHDLMMSRLQILEYMYKEVMPKASADAGFPVDSCVVIFDLQKFGLRHLWKTGINGFIDLAKISEANYPEAMRRCYIVNAPAIFPLAYNLVKPFLNANTINKIVMLGSNYKTELLKYIDAEQLPVCYGGTLVDSDGNEDCREWICWGGEIPTSYYLRLDNTGNATETVVEPGSSLTLDYLVDRPGYILQYEFQTEHHDIKFCVFQRVEKAAKGGGKSSHHHKTKSVLHPLIPNERNSSNLTCIKGEVLLREKGIYVVRFDNTYSWATSKKLTYRIDLLDMYVEGDAYEESYKNVDVNAQLHVVPNDNKHDTGDCSDASSVDSFHSTKDDTTT